MNRCCLLSAKNSGIGTCAYFDQNIKMSDSEICDFYLNNKKMPSSFVLKRQEITKKGMVINDDISDVTNIWEDYQYNQYAWNVFSEAVKKCLDEIRTKDDSYEWIPVEIIGNNEKRIYYVPFFNILPDVLDEVNTTYTKNGSILRPCFASEKINKYSIFSIGRSNWKIPSGLYVTDIVKKTMKKRKFSNIIFEGFACGSETGIII